MMARTDVPGDRLLALVDDIAGVRVAVLGDLLVDEFIYGQISRVSREAPVLILEYDSTDIVPGGAGNAANNVAALGGNAISIGIAGEDEPGRRLLESMRPRIDVRNIVTHKALTTPTKTRILAGGVHSAKQQVVRVDRAARAPIPEAVRTAIARRILSVLGRADALLVSDYGTGFVTPALVRNAQRTLRGPGTAQPPVLVDSRYALLDYRRMTMCTPNESEVEQLLGVRIGENTRVLERAGRQLLERTAAAGVLITRGSRGMALFEPGRQEPFPGQCERVAADRLMKRQASSKDRRHQEQLGEDDAGLRESLVVRLQTSQDQVEVVVFHRAGKRIGDRKRVRARPSRSAAPDRG